MESLHRPRLRQPNRTIPIRAASLDQTLPEDDTVRVIWAYVTTIDLSAFLAHIRAVEGCCGRNATDPRLLLALWMFATTEGIGSARRLAKLCQRDICYRWLCGGVTVNYHLLSDFRQDFETELDQLLTDHVTALVHQELVTLKRVAQDGMRVRANAGGGSFRRAETIDECQAQVAEQLRLLKQQQDEPKGSAAWRSQKAKERHLREKQKRLEEARAVAVELEAKRLQRAKEHPGEAKKNREENAKKKAGRGSTTDPQARQMKMPDGGYRPGYNVQAMTTTEEKIIIGVAVTNQGTDSGLMGEMIEQIEKKYGEAPREVEVDGGFSSVDDVEAAEAKGITVYMPLKNVEKELAAGKNPYAPKRDDKAGMIALRARMGTVPAQEIYKERAATAEWVNAGMRNRGLYGVPIRGLSKVRAVVVIQALVHNLFQTIRLCRVKNTERSWTEILRAGLEKQGRER